MMIIFVSSGLSYHHGGSAFSEGALCSELQKHANVTVLTRKGRVEKAFIEEHQLKDVREFTSLDLLRAFINKRHWIRKLFEKADICHMNGHWKWPYFIFSKISQKNKIPYVIHPRGMMIVGHRSELKKKLFNKIMGQEIVNKASAIIALSFFEEGQFKPYSIPKGKVSVIPNGIPIERNVKHVEPLLPSSVQKYFLYFGRLEARKNLLFLTEAFSKYVEDGGESTLLLVGPAERGYDLAVESHIEKLGLRGKAFVLAPVYQEQKTALLENALAVIYPTVDEPFGRVPFEAIALNSLPIVPDESGSSEYLKKFLPRSIYKHQDKDSLVQVMKAIEHDGNKMKETDLTKARAWMEEDLNWGKIGRQVLSLYENATSSVFASAAKQSR